MFAPITPYKLKPGAHDAAMAALEGMKADIMALTGISQFLNVLDADGHGDVVSVVESETTSDSNKDHVTALWGRMTPHLAEKPVPVGGEVVGDWKP